MESPKHLSHKPIVSVNDYDKKDAIYAGNTDAKALSLGKAQYDSKQISLKVWRHTGEKWSRQSEELPIHRNLDLTILFLTVLLQNKSHQCPKSILNEVIDKNNDVQMIMDYFVENKKYLEPRLSEMKRLLKEIL